jgi:hypothetical protein
MPLLQRITSPIKALLPDLSRVPQRRQAVGAIVASVIVHLLLLLLFMGAAKFLPNTSQEMSKPAVPLQPLEVIVTPSEEKPITPAELKAASEPPVIDSTGLAKATNAPKDAIFQSDQDMKAGSEKPAAGDAPLPSQDGRELPFPQFKDQSVVLGSPKLPASAPSSPAVPPSPARPAQSKPPQLAESKPAAEPPPSTPQPTPKHPEVSEVKDDQIALAQKTNPATPAPMPRLTVPDLAPRPVPEPKRQDMAKLVTPSPRSHTSSGFQEEQTQTRVEGSISNRGPKGVDAVKTPLGTYLKQVKAQIGSRWFYYMKQRRDLFATGSAKISFVITKDGKVRDVRVIDNTSNAAFALMCQQCITEAEITPPPDEAAPVMPNGQLEHDFTFNYVPIQ